MLTVVIALDQPRPDITRNKGVRPELIGAMPYSLDCFLAG